MVSCRCLAFPTAAPIVELAAIIAFLTDAHPDKKLAPAPGEADHAEYLSSLVFMSVNLYQMISIIYAPGMLADTDAEKATVARRAAGECRRALRHDRSAPRQGRPIHSRRSLLRRRHLPLHAEPVGEAVRSRASRPLPAYRQGFRRPCARGPSSRPRSKPMASWGSEAMAHER